MIDLHEPTFKRIEKELEVISVDQELTIFNFFKIKKHILRQLENKEVKNFILFIKDACYIDSSGAGLLLEMNKRIHNHFFFVADFPKEMVDNINNLGILQQTKWYKNFDEALREIK